MKIKRDQEADNQLRQGLDESYRRQDKAIKKECREDKKIWVEARCEEAQTAASKNDIKTTYKVVRELTGP